MDQWLHAGNESDKYNTPANSTVITAYLWVYHYQVDHTSTSKHLLKLLVVIYSSWCLIQSAQMVHRPPADDHIVPSVSEGLQPTHQPVCCANELVLW